MSRWKLIDEIHHSMVFSCQYGHYRADIQIIELAGSMEFGVTWTVIHLSPSFYQTEIMFQERELISMYDFYSVVRYHHRITTEDVVKMIKPCIDKTQFALFCCVAEKLI